MTRDVNPMPGNCKFSKTITAEIHSNFDTTESIIELGCGCGGNLAELSSIAGKLVGIEPHPDNFQKAFKSVGENVTVIHGDHTQLESFGDNQFDVGFTCSVLDHMEDFRGALGELLRVCKNVMLFEPTMSPGRQAREDETNCWQISWYHDYGAWLHDDGLEYFIKPFPLYSTSSGKLFHQIIIRGKP